MLPGLNAWADWRWYKRLFELGWMILPAALCYGLMLWIMGFRRQHFVV
jgi:hypothetical protein